MARALLTRRCVAAGLPLLPIASPLLAAADSADDAGVAFRALAKAMWVWKFAPSQSREIRSFAAAHGISTLFVSIPQADRARLLDGDVRTADAIRLLSDSGLEVLALAGDPSWIERPRDIARPLAALIEIRERLQLFHGLHLDVEPQAHPDWQKGNDAQTALVGKLVEFLATVRSRVRGLAIDVALSPVLSRFRLPGGENALAGISRHVSSVAIMAYRDTAAATVEWAAPALEIVNAAGVGWRIGVLVHESREPRTSFYGAPVKPFRAEMLKLDSLLRKRNGERLFKGLAFEDSAGLLRILATE